MRAEGPFAERVAEGMRAKGYTLRQFCRAAGLDPSFFSKVLSGKRSPPAEEAVLRRIAGLLDVDPAELVVAAGRIPSEWRALWDNAELFRDMHGLATGVRPAPRPVSRSSAASRPVETPLQASPASRPTRGGERERAVPGAIRKSGGARGHIEEELL